VKLLVDLDNVADIERVWSELQRVHAIRAIDPELRANIERHLDQLDADVAAPVRVALDQMHPETVLAIYFEVIVSKRPARRSDP
jgi:hypothetical protein